MDALRAIEGIRNAQKYDGSALWKRSCNVFLEFAFGIRVEGDDAVERLEAFRMWLGSRHDCRCWRGGKRVLSREMVNLTWDSSRLAPWRRVTNPRRRGSRAGHKYHSGAVVTVSDQA